MPDDDDRRPRCPACGRHRILPGHCPRCVSAGWEALTLLDTMPPAPDSDRIPTPATTVPGPPVDA